MAQSEGFLGDGVKVGYSLGSPVAWIELEGVLECVVPKIIADKIDITTHGSTGYKRNMGGLKEVTNTEITLLQDLSHSVQRGLFALLKARTTVWWRVEVPTERDKTLFVPFEFQGYVENFGPSAPIDGRQELMVSVGFDGLDVFMDDAGASEI